MMSLTFGLFTQVSNSGSQGPLVVTLTPFLRSKELILLNFPSKYDFFMTSVQSFIRPS